MTRHSEMTAWDDGSPKPKAWGIRFVLAFVIGAAAGCLTAWWFA